MQAVVAHGIVGDSPKNLMQVHNGTTNMSQPSISRNLRQLRVEHRTSTSKIRRQLVRVQDLQQHLDLMDKLYRINAAYAIRVMLLKKSDE